MNKDIAVGEGLNVDSAAKLKFPECVECRKPIKPIKVFRRVFECTECGIFICEGCFYSACKNEELHLFFRAHQGIIRHVCEKCRKVTDMMKWQRKNRDRRSDL